MEITRREVLGSISIIAVLMLIGVLISGKISEAQMDRNEKYNKAVKIESSDLFQYGMRTNVGNAFVYGDLVAVDAVTYPEIGGEYMYVEKVKERYTKHTKTVTYTDSNGKRKTKTETYWSWDEVWSDELMCDEVTFLDVTFDSGKFNIPLSRYITTIKESSFVRYKYYGTDTHHTGTIFTSLADDTISDFNTLYNATITETVEHLSTGWWVSLFWIFWVTLILACVVGFFYLDNHWLE